MARAMWKGVIRFGKQDVPVKLYAAAEDRTVHFRLLHEKTGRPVKQRMVDPATGEEVDSSRIRRGFEKEPGVFVVLEPDEIDRLQPEVTREIEITRFLDPQRITHAWYDRPYYLGPDGNEEAYFALAAALEAESKEGLARWTMRNKEYAGALRARDGDLMMITLRRAGEVIPASALQPPAGRAPEKQEMKMAQQLVEALADSFEPEQYQDEHRQRVLELIEAKAGGKTVKLPKPRGKREAADLAESLAASIRAAKERKSA